MQCLCISIGIVVICIWFRETAKLIVLSSAVAVSVLKLVIHYYRFETVRAKERHLCTIIHVLLVQHICQVITLIECKMLFQNLQLFFVIIVIHLQSCSSVLSTEDPKLFYVKYKPKKSTLVIILRDNKRSHAEYY